MASSYLVPLPAQAQGLTRRRFLLTLAALAGAGAAAPLVPGAKPAARVDATRPMLGTWVRIVARNRDEALAARGVERAFGAIERVDSHMSVHRPDSQLARVNAAAGRGTVAVDPPLFEVVRLALEGAERSGGIYDPTVLPLMRLYGYYVAASSYPDDRAITTALDRVGWRHLVTEPGRVGLARAGAGIDLGSIGKGWAVDRAVEALRREGVRDGLVDAGGNVFAFGSPDDHSPGWTVGVTHPVTRQVDRAFVLRDAAVATSGNAEQFRILSGLRVGHLFDARRGRPASGHLSATVQAASATAADLMSTAAFLLGPDHFGWPEAQAVHFIG